MPSDSIFKTSTFGGFNKEDVLTYIDNMKTRETGLTKQLTDAHAENTELKKKLEDSERLYNALKRDYDAQRTGYEEKISELEKSYQSEIESKISAYNALKSDQDNRLAGIADEYNLLKDSHSKEVGIIQEKFNHILNERDSEIEKLKNEIDALKNNHNTEIESIKNEYEEKIRSIRIEAGEKRAAEERVGTAMLDVRRYADLLIEETCKKIAVMADDADNAAAKTLSKALEISSAIQSFSEDMNSMLSDITGINDGICQKLTDFKGTLKLPFEEAAGKKINELFED